MPLAHGKRLGSYEILAIVGVGGMGEVYKARDTRLDRIVAIKVLPDHIANDPDSRSRLEREAKAISSLSHPHICTLHDVGREAGIDFLVMEYLDGQTAAQRLARGPIPIQQVLRWGAEIADALDGAHRQGITHRDLKPGNVMLTKSGVKLLDFGLAKLKQGPLESDAASPATAAADLTGSGTILGTLQYMAPEQVEGKAVDHRTDIFAFGAIMYELATGRKAFEGGSQASLIGTILRDDPRPISALQPLSPPALDVVVATCLAKDPDDRWQSAADVSRQLRLMQGSGSIVQPSHAEVLQSAHVRRTSLVAFATLLAGVGATMLGFRMFGGPTPTEPPAVSRFVISPPGSAALTNIGGIDVAISPDGKRIAYLALRGARPVLYVRDLDALESRALVEVAVDSGNPYFSADGQSIVYRAAGEGTMRVALDGGAPSRIGDDVNYGTASGPGGMLVYSNGPTVYEVTAGGAPERLTPNPATLPGPNYAAPTILPNGRHVLVTTIRGADAESEIIVAIDLESHEQHEVVEGANAFVERSGYLVFAHGTTLMAAPFDLSRAILTGEPVAVLQGIRHANLNTAADYGLSLNGTLVYVPNDGQEPAEHVVVWVDRSGRVTERAWPDPLGGARDPRLSRDGRRLLLTTGALGDGDLWVYDLGGAPPVPLVIDGDNRSGTWSPEDERVAFTRGGLGVGWYTIATVAADGRIQTPEALSPRLTEGAGARDWSSADEVIFNRRSPTSDVVSLRIGDLTLREIVATPYAETYPALSPDERWIAYTSDRTGQPEVWVQLYPDGVPIPISSGGGTEPVWSADGTELYYRQGSAVMAVAIGSDGARPFGAPTKLFDGAFFETADSTVRTYDVAPDGRFLMIQPNNTTSDTERTGIVVVQNWIEEVKSKVSAR